MGLRGAETRGLDYGWPTADRGREAHVNLSPTLSRVRALDVKMRKMTRITVLISVLLLLIPGPLVICQAAHRALSA